MPGSGSCRRWLYRPVRKQTTKAVPSRRPITTVVRAVRAGAPSTLLARAIRGSRARETRSVTDMFRL
ncbi:hypothetical protein GCM10009820_06180 [Leifsonia soli]